MQSSLLETLKVLGMLPFFGVILMVLFTKSMSVHFRDFKLCVEAFREALAELSDLEKNGLEYMKISLDKNFTCVVVIYPSTRPQAWG